MNVGIRPRPQLRARSSFFDLIKHRNIEQLSVASPRVAEQFEDDVDDLPSLLPSSIPLPASPRASISSASSNLAQIRPAAPVQKSVKMPPVSFRELCGGARANTNHRRTVLPKMSSMNNSVCYPASISHVYIPTNTKSIGSIYSVSGSVPYMQPRFIEVVLILGQTGRGGREYAWCCYV